MRIIAHRGNLNGPNSRTENTVQAVEDCLAKGFDVEIDVQDVYGHDIFIGHDVDGPTERMKLVIYDSKRYNRLWLHAKNFNAFKDLMVLKQNHGYQNFDIFYHETDFSALTFNRYFWIYPNTKLSLSSGKNSILVMPESVNLQPKDLVPYTFFGVCTDYPNEYKKVVDEWRTL